MKTTTMTTIQPDTEYRMKLEDNSDQQGLVQLRVQKSPGDNLLMVGADGYGEKTALDGDGFPIVIEFHEGKFRLLVWADINQEDPTHIISLEGAREDARNNESNDVL